MKCDCVTSTSDRLIPLADAGRRMVVVNIRQRELDIVKYDGCEIKGDAAVDFIARIDGAIDYLLELKGRNIEDALDQISETINRMRESGDIMPSVFAAIHCRQVPKSGREVIKKRERLKRRFGLDVAISSSKKCFCIETKQFIEDRRS